MSRLAIVLLDHGSRREEANVQLDELRERVAARRPDARVFAAHLGVVPPDLQQAIDAAVAEGAERVIVHPFFLLPGKHTATDVPQQVEDARARHPEVDIVHSAALGLDDALVDIVLTRIAAVDDRS